MKAFLVIFSRIFVGVLFLISGFIKLNDPTGFSFKLQEYFEVFHIGFLSPFAMVIGLFLLYLEVLLGILLLIGLWPKFTTKSLLALIVFFTFLTLFSAVTNKVTDCGCFGDALKLTPWESFTKDIVLLVFIFILFIWRDLIKPVFPSKINHGIAIASLIVCLGITYQVLNHLPMIDFRAYKVGTNITQGMQIPEGAPKDEYEMIFVYEVNGVPTEFSYDQIMAGEYPQDATFIDRKQKLIKEGYKPPVKDFSMERDGSNFADNYLREPKLVMITSYDMTKADTEALKMLGKFYNKALESNYKVIGLTGTDLDYVAGLQKEYGFYFDFYFCDPTTVKTIERANPSIVVLHRGTIVKKVHWKDAKEVFGAF